MTHELSDMSNLGAALVDTAADEPHGQVAGGERAELLPKTLVLFRGVDPDMTHDT
jgi:hypothetical protein